MRNVTWPSVCGQLRIFERHDWVVKRADGTEARYVIDFYAGKAPPGSNAPVAMHLDVRPALDSFDVSMVAEAVTVLLSYGWFGFGFGCSLFFFLVFLVCFVLIGFGFALGLLYVTLAILLALLCF